MYCVLLIAENASAAEIFFYVLKHYSFMCGKYKNSVVSIDL